MAKRNEQSPLIDPSGEIVDVEFEKVDGDDEIIDAEIVESEESSELTPKKAIEGKERKGLPAPEAEVLVDKHEDKEMVKAELQKSLKEVEEKIKQVNKVLSDLRSDLKFEVDNTEEVRGLAKQLVVGLHLKQQTSKLNVFEHIRLNAASKETLSGSKFFGAMKPEEVVELGEKAKNKIRGLEAEIEKQNGVLVDLQREEMRFKIDLQKIEK